MKPKNANKFSLFLFLFYVIFVPLILSPLIYFNLANDAILIILQDLILILVPLGIYFLLTKQKLSEVLPHKKLSLKNVVYIVLLTILTSPIIQTIATISSFFVPENTTNKIILTSIKDTPLLLLILAFSIMPAITEELLFRGVVLQNYKNVKFVFAALISGLFFGLFHLNLYQLGYAVFSGIFFSYLVAYTNSIYSSILSHFLINGSQIVITKLVFTLIGNTDAQHLIDESLTTNASSVLNSISPLIFLTILFTPLLIYTTKSFMKYNSLNKVDYFYSIDNNNLDNLKINYTKEKENSFVDLYFLLYVIFSLALCFFPF